MLLARSPFAWELVSVYLSDGWEGAAEPDSFRADHPFLFLIHTTRSRAILFMGRVVDPRSRESLEPVLADLEHSADLLTNRPGDDVDVVRVGSHIYLGRQDENVGIGGNDRVLLIFQ